MSAQEKWKREYRAAMDNFKLGRPGEAREHLAYAQRYRRESALERRCEAMRRENKRLRELLDAANLEAWHERL